MTSETQTSHPPTCYSQVESPLGELILVGTPSALGALYFGSNESNLPSEARDWLRDDQAFATVTQQLRAYFAGQLRSFDVPLAPRGTPFQQRVWTTLSQIPYGATWTYGQMARRIGQPGAARAVGLANGRNPIPIIIPCHRLIGADGRLVGYGGGLPNKRWLLALEGSAPELPLHGAFGRYSQ